MHMRTQLQKHGFRSFLLLRTRLRPYASRRAENGPRGGPDLLVQAARAPHGQHTEIGNSSRDMRRGAQW